MISPTAKHTMVKNITATVSVSSCSIACSEPWFLLKGAVSSFSSHSPSSSTLIHSSQIILLQWISPLFPKVPYSIKSSRHFNSSFTSPPTKSLKVIKLFSFISSMKKYLLYIYILFCRWLKYFIKFKEIYYYLQLSFCQLFLICENLLKICRKDLKLK